MKGRGGTHGTCGTCGTEVKANNITRMCLECKHIARAERAGYTAEEVPLDEARTNFMAAFRGLYRTQPGGTA